MFPTSFLTTIFLFVNQCQICVVLQQDYVGTMCPLTDPVFYPEDLLEEEYFQQVSVHTFDPV